MYHFISLVRYFFISFIRDLFSFVRYLFRSSVRYFVMSVVCVCVVFRYVCSSVFLWFLVMYWFIS